MILSNLGIGAHYEGRWTDALEYFERTRETAQKAGDLVGETLAADNAAQFLSDRGLFEEADRVLRSSLRVWRAIGHREFLGLCLNLLGRNCARTGRFDEALDLLAGARSELEHVGYSDGVLDTDAKIAECRAFMGDAETALALVKDALERAAASEGGAALPLLELVRGYALAQLGDVEEARAAFHLSLQRARERGGGAHFDETLAIVALMRLSRATREPIPEELERTGRDLIATLGIMSVPLVPLTPAG
jgi:tetratricopeptide (TPR) repeat protein